MSSRRAFALVGVLVVVCAVASAIVITALGTTDQETLKYLVVMGALCLAFALSSLVVLRWLLHAQDTIVQAMGEEFFQRTEESAKAGRKAIQIQLQELDQLRDFLDDKLEEAQRAIDEGDGESAERTLKRGLETLDSALPAPCGNPAVDSMLLAKATQLEQQGIAVDYKLSLLGDLPLSGVEMTAVLFNLLDNAASGCLEASGDNVSVSMLEQAGMLVVNVSNPCVASSRRRAERKAPKDASSAHGWGTGIVTEIVRRHGGVASFEAKDGVFSADVAIPLERERL